MKANHLFASAALATVLLAALPAHAILGGAVRGGVSGTQAATFGSGFGTAGTSASGNSDLSGYGRAGGRVDRIGHLDQTTRAAKEGVSRDAGNTRTDTIATGRQAVGTGEFEASHASSAALGTVQGAAGSRAATSATAVGQTQAQDRNADVSGAVAGGLSAAEGAGTKPEPGSTTSSPGTVKKAESPGASPNSPKGNDRSSAPKSKTGGSTTSRETARGGGTHGAPEANFSADMDASATG
jgi:hypothetical protein